EDPEIDDSLSGILAQLGVRDERIYAAICDLFDRDEILGALAFADYGDERALTRVKSAIECFEPDYGSPLGIMGLADLVETFEALGGTLPDDLREHVDALLDDWAKRMNTQSSRAQGKKTGRNDPCPCASGKKFKKCCLGKAVSPHGG